MCDDGIIIGTLLNEITEPGIPSLAIVGHTAVIAYQQLSSIGTLHVI